MSASREQRRSRAQRSSVPRATCELGQPPRAGGGALRDRLRPGRLWIATILHQATIRVDEAGTEAAAATAVGVEATSAPAPPKSIDLEVDRPLLFVLRDKRTSAAGFTGLVSDPT